MVGYERTGCSTSRNTLKNRGFHLKTARLVEIFPHGGNNLASLDEGVPHLRIHYEVHISLTIFELGVAESIENLTVFFLDYRKHTKGFAQECELFGVDGKLSGLGDEGIALDAYDVTYVEEFLEDGIIHSLVLARAYFITLDIHLNSACLVLKFDEGSRAHNPAGHNSSGNAYIRKIALLGVVTLLDGSCSGIHRIQRCRIRLDAQFAEFAQGIPAALFLFV